jgi:hypothetical protein
MKVAELVICYQSHDFDGRELGRMFYFWDSLHSLHCCQKRRYLKVTNYRTDVLYLTDAKSSRLEFISVMKVCKLRENTERYLNFSSYLHIYCSFINYISSSERTVTNIRIMSKKLCGRKRLWHYSRYRPGSVWRNWRKQRRQEATMSTAEFSRTLYVLRTISSEVERDEALS